VAIQATIHRLLIALSDVDRGVYEALDLRVARHPSESMRYLLTRTLAYALSYEEGIAFSKGGISQTDEAPVSVRDRTGVLLAWIDVGSPSAERLHKASKAAPRVAVFTHSDLALLRRDAGKIHKVEAIEVLRIDTALLDAMEPLIERHTAFDLTRNDGRLYVTLGDATLEGAIRRESLVP
jgi:uncharacterized protein YaeQ